MSNVASVDDLFQDALDDGILSTASANVLNAQDIGQQIQNGLGINPDLVEASEVVLCAQLIDDSSSIQFSGLKQSVIDGHNLVIDSINNSKQQDNVFGYTLFLNDGIFNAFTPIQGMSKLDSQNYQPSGYTPLFDKAVIMLGTVLAESQKFLQTGTPCRTISLIVTDGYDNGMMTAKDVKKIVVDMLKEENHIIAFMGIAPQGDQVAKDDYKRVAKEMGILDNWILTPDNTQSDIRKAFEIFSRSASQASQGGVNFSQTALGGFGI